MLVFFLPVLIAVLWTPVSSAVQRNRAFVRLNHLPSLFTGEADPAALAAAEALLRDSLRDQPGDMSARRMLAVVSYARAGNEIMPAGLSTADLLWWGQQKERAGELDAAGYLFEWAAAREPALGDAWYQLGRLQQSRADHQAAHRAFRQAAAATVWQQTGRSDVFAALGDSYRFEKPTPNIMAALESYRRALQIDDFREPGNKAAAHYALGELLLWEKEDADAAIGHYRAALAIRPDDHWARLRLGYALYWGAGDLAGAEQEILRAIGGWPDDQYLQWPYYYLGELYEDAGRTSDAIDAYERALVLDPGDQRLRDRLAGLRGP